MAEPMHFIDGDENVKDKLTMAQVVHPAVVALYAKMFAYGLKPAAVLKRAPLGKATWWRWTKGARPNTSSLDKVEAAIDAMIDEIEFLKSTETDHGATRRG